VGEYACNSNVGQGHLLGALSEAAFMIGMERNSDIVKMCSYAPLFFNVNDISWPVNLIGFDSARVVGRTSYHVQKLFARNRPDEVMPTSIENPGPKPDIFALAGLDKSAHELVVKAVNRSGRPQSVELELAGFKLSGGRGRIITLSHEDPTAENSLDDPDVVAPVESELNIGSERTFELRTYSLTILRLPLAAR
jgi:alpha-N-arabinofuranosidase